MADKIAIIGSGSWATALVKIFTESGNMVSWLMRDAEIANIVNSDGRNPRYLSAVNFDRSLITATVNFAEACAGAELAIFAVPSAYLKDTLKKIDKSLLNDVPVAVSIKSFVPGTNLTPAQFIGKQLQRPARNIIVLGGPCHAEEIATSRETYLTIAGNDAEFIKKIIGRLTCDYVIPVESDDPLGIEYASILKNVIAIAAGIADGLLYGQNFQSVLVSNAMREAADFIQAAVPGSRDFFRSAYFGDLLVTAYSDLSRNRMLGKLVGRGMSAGKAIHSMEMVAEGYYASKELYNVVHKLNLHSPVLNAVHRILHKHASPFQEFRLLKEQFS